MVRVFKVGLVVVCGGAAALALSGGPVAAATGTSKSVPGAYGSISGIRWADQTKATFTLTVKDTAADGIHAEGRVQLVQTDDQVITFGAHKAIGKGHVYSNPGAYVTDNRPIRGIRILVCATGVSDSTGKHISLCGASAWAYRPT